MITFFDIPADAIPGRAWSPNTWKTRLSLNIKGLPYKTTWVEYPDIKGVLQEHNIGPTGTSRDGNPYYSLPAIIDADDATGEVKAALAESLEIAKYLDAAYPDTPKLVPDAAVQQKFVDDLRGILGPLFIFALKATHTKINEKSKAHFSRARAMNLWPFFHTETLEEIVIPPEVLEKRWAVDVKAAFGALDQRLGSEEEKEWYLGDSVSFVDLVVASYLIWIKKVFGEESREWKDIKSWSNGRWERFDQRFAKYQVVEEESTSRL